MAWLQDYGGQEVKCVSLSDNSLHRLINVNAWSPGFDTIWNSLKGLGLALLEKWGLARGITVLL